jgi:hypothetical protein
LDWALQVRELLDVRYPKAKRVTLVSDNLNTHDVASLYEAFAPAEARRLMSRLEMVHTPKHGSWLNIAEIELNVLSRQCFCQMIGDVATLIPLPSYPRAAERPATSRRRRSHPRC